MQSVLKDSLYIKEEGIGEQKFEFKEKYGCCGINPNDDCFIF